MIYVDDIIHIDYDTKDFMNIIRAIYRLKDVVGEMDQYLGAKIQKLKLEDEKISW